MAKGHTSHFRTIRDSVRVYLPILKSGLFSSVSSAIDFIALLILQYATGNLLLSVIMARLLSATLNFFLNQTYVFKSRNRSTASRLSWPRS